MGQCQNCAYISPYQALTTEAVNPATCLYKHSAAFGQPDPDSEVWSVFYGNHLFWAMGTAEETLVWCRVWLKANLDKDQLCQAPFQEVLGAVLSCDLVLLPRLWLIMFHMAPSCTCSVLWSVFIMHGQCQRCWWCNCNTGNMCSPV